MSKRAAPGASTGGMKSAGFYDAHSEYQRRVLEAGDELVRSSVGAVDASRVEGAFGIADYGAGTGATSVHAVGTAIAALRERERALPVIAIHNDVPTSDFSGLFRSAAGPDGYLGLGGGPIYATAAAGSFFAQVVPSGTVHLGMCSNAAHWLREQPRGVRIEDGMYFCEARGAAREELARQAAADWLAFLEARAAELAPGGRLLVQGISVAEGGEGCERTSASRLLRVMWEVAAGLADDGRLDWAALEDYVFPVYSRSAGDAAAPVTGDGPLAGAFEVAHSAIDEVVSPYWEAFERDGDADAYATSYAEFVRAFSESTMVEHLFRPGARGVDPDALADEYFDRLRSATAADPEAGRYEAWILRLVLERGLEAGSG
jgi:hypothetical protein